MADEGRGRQVVRQWAVLQALEGARAGMTIDELVEAVDQTATRRTLYRDVDQLMEAGFPVIREDGRVRLAREGRLAWTMPVQPTEVLALLFTEQLASPLEGTSVGESLGAVRNRLRALLTPVGRKVVGELQQLALATLFAPGHYAGHRLQIDAIQDAIYREQAVRIRYAKPGSADEDRVVEPYATWYHSGRFYVIGRCRSREDVRTFSIQRIVEAEVLDETFEPDPAFDVAAFVRKGFGVYQDAVHRIAVEFRPEVAHLARERTYHHTQTIRPRDDGSVVLEMEASGLPEIASWIASFGGKARPVRPPELIERVRALHEAGLRALGDIGGRDPI